MAISVPELYEEMKHGGRLLDQEEVDEIVDILTSDLPEKNPHLDLIVRIYCLSRNPTTRDKQIVNVFLTPDTDDQVRASAVRGIYSDWGLYDFRPDFVIETLQRTHDWHYESTITALFSVIFDIYFNTDDEELKQAISKKISFYRNMMAYNLKKIEDEESNFIHLANCLLLYRFRIEQKPYDRIESAEEALKVLENWE